MKSRTEETEPSITKNISKQIQDLRVILNKQSSEDSDISSSEEYKEF